MNRTLVATLLILLLSACASAPPGAPESALEWPGAPAPARVRYVQSVAAAEDLGIRRSLLQRLGDLLFGGEELRLVRPMAVTEAGSALYVADPGMRGVHRFERSAGRHQVIRRSNSQDLPSPVGLARGGNGEVYVTDASLRKVFVIRPGAEEAAELPLSVDLRQPTGIAFDASTGRLFVTDTAAHQVLVFGRNGQLAARLGRRGEGVGEFNFPTLLWRDAAGRLYVTDSLNFRVQIFDAEGSVVTSFGRHGNASGDLARHKGVATDSHGHIYVVDALLHAVQIFDPTGRLLMGLGGQGQGRGEFWLPAGLYIAPDDTIYVADAFNRRLQVLRYVGGPT